MDLMNIENIKNKIEGMNKHHHIEILKLIKKNPNTKINENKSGVYINLSFLPKSTMDDIQNYLHYVQDQECLLIPFESQKEDFKNTFFIEKEVKDDALYTYIN